MTPCGRTAHGVRPDAFDVDTRCPSCSGRPALPGRRARTPVGARPDPEGYQTSPRTSATRRRSLSTSVAPRDREPPPRCVEADMSQAAKHAPARSDPTSGAMFAQVRPHLSCRNRFSIGIARDARRGRADVGPWKPPRACRRDGSKGGGDPLIQIPASLRVAGRPPMIQGRSNAEQHRCSRHGDDGLGSGHRGHTPHKRTV